MRCEVLCRKRYVDEKMIESLQKGIKNVVILGTGLDPRVYRFSRLPAIQVFEVDLPRNIEYKKKRLKQLYGTIPPQVRLVPIDFSNQDLESVLKEVGYSTDQKSFFIWEGVTEYLSESTVRRIFKFLAKAKPGSRMVFTYIVKDFIEGKRTYGLKSLYQQTRVKGKFFFFGLHPGHVADFLEGYSWKELEQAGTSEYRAKYLKPVGRKDAVMEIERAVYAEKVSH